jgi:hypothetical protein
VNGQIDFARFSERSGGLNIMPLVADAFFRQLPSWREAFAAATSASDMAALAELLHKMKGCCHTLAAHDAALQFELAEQALENGDPAYWQRHSAVLLDRIIRIEAELRSAFGENDISSQT